MDAIQSDQANQTDKMHHASAYPEKCLHFFAAKSDVTSCIANPAQGLEGSPSREPEASFKRLQPFLTQPDPLARAAAENLKQRLIAETADTVSTLPEGKMYGVLVVKWKNSFAYLAAFSGKLNGQWQHGKFVPPPFDIQKISNLLDWVDVEIKALQAELREQGLDENIVELEQQLTEKETQYGHAHVAMSELHQKRKDVRRQLREQLITNSDFHIEADSAAGTADEKVRKDLARQSQNDKKDRKTLRRMYEQERSVLDTKLKQLQHKKQALEEHCHSVSLQAHKTYFSLFRVLTNKGIPVDLLQLVEGKMPPSGTGECAGAKLLAFAHEHALEPVSMTEFWWGQATSGQVRHHGNYYPACRGKCGLLLPRMLPGHHLLQAPILVHKGCGSFDSIADIDQTIRIVYEDESLVVVDKPAGLLSVPGKVDLPSVLDWARSKWPLATGPLLVHRLDMDTSGLLVIAKTATAHRLIQQQFERRTIEKIYDALLENIPQKSSSASGTVNLPLRVDLDDRPRQVVCHEHGKSARTHWKITGLGFWSPDEGYVQTTTLKQPQNQSVITVSNLQKSVLHDKALTRMEFRPATGRTHQLRVHAASPQGLNSPIVGDPLYGRNPDLTNTNAVDSDRNFKRLHSGSLIPQRMMLHARTLTLQHPITGEPLTVTAQAPF